MRMMSWNIKAGGFDSYDSTAETPQREEQIKGVITGQHKKGVTTVGLPDAHRWDKVYGGNEGIAAHLGFASARFVNLGDKRFDDDAGKDIGIVLATDERIHEDKVLDLGTRAGLGVVLDVGEYGLQIAEVYYDDLDEETRLQHNKRLKSELIKDVPTVIVGDINALRDDMSGASRADRLKDRAIRIAAPLLPGKSGLVRSIKGMNERRVVADLRERGFKDGDPLKRPTAPAALPAFGIDGVYYNDFVEVGNFDVIGGADVKAASDHLAIAFDATPLPWYNEK
jgi:endonuclease/exonuclease/phosphatase family metal-dependent hydrolase